MEVYKKPVVGYPAYEISIEGKVYRAASGAEMSLRQAGSGYLRFTVTTGGVPRQKTVSVHRMVAEAFIPNPENKPFVNHLDGNKRNNRLENLEWCTAKENTQHALATGLAPSQKGVKNPASKLTEQQVIAIKRLIALGAPSIVIAHAAGVDPCTIYEIKAGKNWADLELETPAAAPIIQEGTSQPE